MSSSDYKRQVIFSFYLSFSPKMSRQLQAKQFIIIGDSNVEQNLLHSGRLYFEQSDIFKLIDNQNNIY